MNNKLHKNLDVVDIMKPKEKRVVIGMPCQDEVKAKTLHSLVAATMETPELFDFLMWQGCDVAGARTWIAKEAIKKGATHLLFVDSDMLFPRDTIKRLLAHNKDIVGVQCNKRLFPLQKVAVPLTPNEDQTKLFRAALVGTGVLLIKTSVFEKMARPWFQFGRDKEGELVIGEDAWFINSAKDAGFDVWCDGSIKVGHIGNYTY